MLKLLFIIVITVFLNIIAFAQQEKNTAPINWERYKVSDKQISILLPKMPVFYQSSNICEETESNKYAVFAEEVVYQLKVFSKSKRKIPNSCDVKNKFGKETLERRLRELKTLSIIGSEKKITENNKEVTEFKEKFTTHWVFDDLKNDKWIEISATHWEDIKPDLERFRKSLQFEKTSTGKEIGNGAVGTFGDELPSEKDEISKADSSTEKTEGLMIVSKVPARYTDGARDADVQGTVTLRVVFLANGGIGSVTPVTSLPYGLTEQAIAAAKKITFLPARRNGKKYNVVKQVQYSFSIF